MAEFQIETEEGEHGTSIRLSGELDSATADAVLDRVERAVAADPPRVILDLAALTFIDSAGLRAIIMLERLARERNVTTLVIPPPAPLLELLEVTGLTDRLSLADEVKEKLQEERFLERIELELPREPTAPRQARDELRRALEARVAEMDLATAVLLASELVTNAVLHPDSDPRHPIGIQIISYADRLRVEIADTGSGFDPGHIPERPPDIGGRGLMVVDRLASRWGAARSAQDGQPRFCVWYELDNEARESSQATEAGVG